MPYPFIMQKNRPIAKAAIYRVVRKAIFLKSEKHLPSSCMGRSVSDQHFRVSLPVAAGLWEQTWERVKQC